MFLSQLNCVNSSYLCKWGNFAMARGELAEDKGPSFGHHGEYAIDHHSSGPTGHGSWPVCIPRLCHPLINTKHSWHHTTQWCHSCSYAESRQSVLEVVSLSQQSWSSITLVSYQSFNMDLNAGQSPRWMHAGLTLLISGAWEHCLESNGTNLFATRRWGG